jgi:hypothetical protein
VKTLDDITRILVGHGAASVSGDYEMAGPSMSASPWRPRFKTAMN